MRPLCLLLLATLFVHRTTAQSLYLQLEKVNSAKTTKYALGEAFEYRTVDDPEWQVGRLEALVPEENLIVFQNRYVRLADITALRHSGPQRWSRPAGGSLVAFGASWGLFSVISGVFDRENDPLEVRDGVIALGAAGLGYGLMHVFRYRRYPLAGRYRLRILDLRALDRSVTN